MWPKLRNYWSRDVHVTKSGPLAVIFLTEDDGEELSFL